MAIKPIENKVDHAAIATKIGLLVLLIGIGFLLGRIPTNRKIPENEPVVLSAESEIIEKINPGDMALNLVDKSKDAVGDVLGTATDLVGELASNSASAVSDFIVEKTTTPFIDQLNKLPPDQQAEIKKNICK